MTHSNLKNEKNKQTQQYTDTYSPNKLTKSKQTFNNPKLMATVFQEEKRMMLVEFI